MGRRRPGRRPWGTAAAGGWGKTERGARGTHPRSHFGRRGSEVAVRLRRAVAGSGTRGGGAGG